MEIKYNVPGNKRKELVKTIAFWLGEEIKYCGAPSFAYEVDYFTIDKDGRLFFDDSADSEVIERLLEHLYDEGFEFEEADNGAVDRRCDISVKIPRNLLTDGQLENLRKLVKSKESLIRKAIKAEALPIIVNEDTVEFPWFGEVAEPEEVRAYTELVTALVKAAKAHTRVTGKDRDVENEKYAFRCFLLRLGFVGDEYKEARKILLRNFTGSAAFKRKDAAVPTPENTVRFDVEEAKRRLKDPAVQAEIKALLDGGDEE